MLVLSIFYHNLDEVLIIILGAIMEAACILKVGNGMLKKIHDWNYRNSLGYMYESH